MVIFFDIDDTIVDSESAHLLAIEQTGIRHDLFAAASRIEIREWLNISNRYFKRYFEGELTLEQQRILRIKEFWESHGSQITESQAAHIYDEYHQLFLKSCIKFSDAVPTLEMLGAYELGIISNGTYKDQIFKLNNNNLMRFFKTIIISEKVGHAKPGRMIFEQAAQMANAPVSHCIYVGNSYEIDYEGSKNAGMRAIWLDRSRTNQFADSATAFSLNDLITMVAKASGLPKLPR